MRKFLSFVLVLIFAPILILAASLSVFSTASTAGPVTEASVTIAIGFFLVVVCISGLVLVAWRRCGCGSAANAVRSQASNDHKEQLPWWLKPKPVTVATAALPPFLCRAGVRSTSQARTSISSGCAPLPVVRSWINHNRRSKYIPEEVLEKLGGVSQ